MQNDLPLGLLKKHDGIEDAIARAFELTWGRKPSDAEYSAAIEFVTHDRRGVASNGDHVQRQSLTDFCHVLLNSNEFLYVN